MRASREYGWEARILRVRGSTACALRGRISMERTLQGAQLLFAHPEGAGLSQARLEGRNSVVSALTTRAPRCAS
jgi:hypothetical protein